MWLFTRHGFFSITRSQQEPDKLQVRARVRRDLENLQTLTGLSGGILETPTADYRWRVIVTPEQAEPIVQQLAKDITYANFKSSVAARPDQTSRSDDLHEIWDIHRRWQRPILT